MSDKKGVGMSFYNGWIEGYKVEISDWYDGVHDYMNIAYYKPGSSLSHPPFIEHGYLFCKTERETIMSILNSVVYALTNNKEFWQQSAPGTIAVVSVEYPIISGSKK